MTLCCEDFRISVEITYYIAWHDGWWLCDNGGWLLCRIKYCPFCGAELKDPYGK